MQEFTIAQVQFVQQLVRKTVSELRAIAPKGIAWPKQKDELIARIMDDFNNPKVRDNLIAANIFPPDDYF